MKRLPLLFALLFGLINVQILTAQILTAQTGQVSVPTSAQQQTAEILNNFKATKKQRKVIAKINRYVAPRILGEVSDRRRAGLVGKVVKTQINFDSNGAITAITIIDGMGEKIDGRIKKLIKDYDQEKSIGKGLGNTPVIQLAVPLIGKKYTL